MVHADLGYNRCKRRGKSICGIKPSSQTRFEYGDLNLLLGKYPYRHKKKKFKICGMIFSIGLKLIRKFFDPLKAFKEKLIPYIFSINSKSFIYTYKVR